MTYTCCVIDVRRLISIPPNATGVRSRQVGEDYQEERV